MRQIFLCIGLIALTSIQAWVPSFNPQYKVQSPVSFLPPVRGQRSRCLHNANFVDNAKRTQRLWASESDSQSNEGSKVPFLLDVNTRGGLVFVSTVGTLGVFAGYNAATALGVDGLQAGIYISVAMTIGMVAWTLSYIFRVANKDMTYVKQLKNYEDAVLAKRLEELEEDEVEALLEEVEKEGVDLKQ